MTEQQLQIKVFKWIKLSYKKYQGLCMAFHCPNEGDRGALGGHIKQLEGLATGYPDVGVDTAERGYNGLRIELKVGKNDVSFEQCIWLTNLNNHNYYAVVCYSFESAINVIKWYFGEDKKFETVTKTRKRKGIPFEIIYVKE